MLYLHLQNGLKMPILGLGTWLATNDILLQTIETALELGYRHFDTANNYGNEKSLGIAINKWINEGKGTRSELFITTKLPPVAMYPQKVQQYVRKSLENLQLDYLDLYLIHNPYGLKEEDINTVKKEDLKMDENVDRIAIWKILEEQVKMGFIKSLGVSNFSAEQLDELYSNESIVIKPVCHQIECHLYRQREDMVEFCKEKGIVTVAYSPLGSPGINEYYQSQGSSKEVPNLLTCKEVQFLAAKYNRSPAQVLLRYTIQRGIAAVPKSSNRKRMAENLALFDFNLEYEDMASLAALDLALPVVGNWETWTWVE